MTPLVVLSHFQTDALFDAHKRGDRQVDCSLNLGLTTMPLALDDDGLVLPNGFTLSWKQLQQISETKSVCFRFVGNGIEPVRGYSQQFNRAHHLMPTRHAPTLVISGFAMHRFRDVDPAQGAAQMVKCLEPLRGRHLDTATGLGYAAIAAATSAQEVVTIELDPMSQEMAALNPWSSELFSNANITRLLGNSCELIQTFDSESFSTVLHDPPAINLAGEMYSGQMYHQLARVLNRKGRLFHYIGDPHSASGSRTTKGVMRRLMEVGFSRIVAKPEAFGVIAYK
ncbi:MAG TPA: hypothetical protein VL137_08695 [Polyangiaceae bacterium]|nr:hypothetical protein [Polyangiaceae bacterium]